MTSNRKALFFDVDSTLYTHRVHDLPASTKDLLIKAKKIKEYFERILNFYRCKKGNGSLMVHSLFIHGIVKKI